jgi:hypothetical protein
MVRLEAGRPHVSLLRQLADSPALYRITFRRTKIRFTLALLLPALAAQAQTTLTNASSSSTAAGGRALRGGRGNTAAAGPSLPLEGASVSLPVLGNGQQLTLAFRKRSLFAG